MTISSDAGAADVAKRQFVSVPNVLNGTTCGRLTFPDCSLIGRRVVHDESFGTICYAGVLPESKGWWIGVDWDNPARGRHNGSYRGVQFFQTSTATSGSFLRPEKVSLGTSLEEAFVYRYVLCAECQLSASQHFIPVTNEATNGRNQSPAGCFHLKDSSGTLSGYFGADSQSKNMEYTGAYDYSDNPIRVELFTKPSATRNADQHKLCGPQGAETTLKTLRTAQFSLVPVYRALFGPPTSETATLWPLPGGTLGKLLPNLTELDISCCLFSKWKDVAEIGIQLPWLRYLNVSSNHLRLPVPKDVLTDDETSDIQLRKKFDLDVDSRGEALFLKAFPELRTLVLVRSPFLDWSGLFRIILWMPSLTSLSIAYNQLGNLPLELEPKVVEAFCRLHELDLTETQINDLSSLFSVIGPSSVLDTLLLSQNPVSVFPKLPIDSSARQTDDPFAPSVWFKGLKTLHLHGTAFTDWSSVNQLLHLHKLDHLFFSECPVFNQLTIETARQELIARLPHVSYINRMEVTAEERRGAELDYLKRYGDVWRSQGGSESEGPDGESAVKISPDFAREHPVFLRLCDKWGVPECGESKLITRSLKEGLTNLKFVLQPQGEVVPSPIELSRRIHGRMIVGHLKMMVRRLFKLSPKTSFDLVAQGERHRKIDIEVPLDVDTREVGFYCIEDGDNVFVRLHA